MDPNLGSEIEALEGVIAAAARHILLDANGEPVPYDPEIMGQLTTDISTAVLTTLADPAGAKWICNVVLVQAIGAGIHSNTGCRWNTAQDTYAMVPFSTSAMCAVITVYRVACPEPPSFSIAIPG